MSAAEKKTSDVYDIGEEPTRKWRSDEVPKRNIEWDKTLTAPDGYPEVFVSPIEMAVQRYCTIKEVKETIRKRDAKAKARGK